MSPAPGPGFTDLHCHLLWGLDDGARTLEDSLEMARALVELGFSAVAPSPHARPEYASRTQALARLDEVRAAVSAAGLPLELAVNAENDLMDERFVGGIAAEDARRLGQGSYVLVEAPYASPVPALPDMIFRVKLKGITPLIAHPERCMEFERKGRAAEAVRAGARLQLDIGALTGRYGTLARRLARSFLEEGLYAVGATDLHGPTGARDWIGAALAELRSRVGEAGFLALMRDNPARVLRGLPLES